MSIDGTTQPPVIDVPPIHQFDERPSLVIPMVYDVNANITQLAERRDSTGTITSSATNSASQLLRRFAEQHKANAAVSGECTIFPAVRELLTNYVMPMEGDAAAAAVAATTAATTVTVNSSGTGNSGSGNITLSGTTQSSVSPITTTTTMTTTANTLGQHNNSVILTTEPIQKQVVSVRVQFSSKKSGTNSIPNASAAAAILLVCQSGRFRYGRNTANDYHQQQYNSISATTRQRTADSKDQDEIAERKAAHGLVPNMDGFGICLGEYEGDVVVLLSKQFV